MSARKVTPEIDAGNMTTNINDLLKLTGDEGDEKIEADGVVENQFRFRNDVGMNENKEEDLELTDTSSEISQSKTGLTQNQNRVLYLLSLYSRSAKDNMQKEKWIRKQALIVLLYEGVVLQSLDYDYAPFSRIIEKKRVYLNISQEAISDIDYLREEEFVNSLTLTTESFDTSKCFQISEKGEDLIKMISKSDQDAVHEFVFAPGTKALLEVKWIADDSTFVLHEIPDPSIELKSEIKRLYNRKSTVTECEDVSYVSSAYVPQCLRGNGRPTYSNAHRSHECSQGALQIKDELDEVITLSSVSIFVAEYIPTGPNNLVTLNKNLSSVERISGGFFSKQKDVKPLDTCLEISPGLTNISVLDFHSSEFINIEADIHFPVQEGTVQIETFGVSVNQSGAVFCGMQVEAVMDKIKDNISLDHLARLLVDVNTDSSEILDSIISEHQRKLLDFMFNQERYSREKVSIMVANEIVPQLPAEEYLDKGDYENEVKQIVGDIRGSYDISEYDVLFFGSNGLLLAGPNCRHHEILLCSYLELRALDNFLQSFFNRLFFLIEEIRNLRGILNVADKDPTSASKIRERLASTAESMTQLEEILGFFQDSISILKLPSLPGDEGGRNLFEYLRLGESRIQLQRRVTDLAKSVSSAKSHLKILQENARILRTQKEILVAEEIRDKIEREMESLYNMVLNMEHLLRLSVFVAGGLFAFAILDRFTGNWTVVNSAWMHSFAELFILETPFLWFSCSIFFAFFLIFFLKKFVSRRLYFSRGVITLRVVSNKKINIMNMNRLLQQKHKQVIKEQRSYLTGKILVQVCWVEDDNKDWAYYSPRITLLYDEQNQFLFFADVEYNQRQANQKLAFNALELKERLELELKAADIFPNADLLESKESDIQDNA